MHAEPIYDCVIIGGGPSGLTAAIHLARLRRSVLVIEDDSARARYIPRSYNHPGFPAGIGGTELLARLWEQLAAYTYDHVRGRAEMPTADDRGFRIYANSAPYRGRSLLLATGIVDRIPPFIGASDAMASGHLRQCPVCDAYEAIDRSVIVFGASAHAAGEALFLRRYTTEVALLTLGATPTYSNDVANRLIKHGVAVNTTELVRVEVVTTGEMSARFVDGTTVAAEIAYSAYGVEPRTELAAELGVVLAPNGRLRVDEYQQTSVPGLYAAGDVVTGLNQLAVAMAHAEIAAGHINRGMRSKEQMTADDVP